MEYAKQSTAKTVIIGPVLNADGVAVTDGVVADLKLSKNGGIPAALNVSATLTHRHTGHYSLALTASDLDTIGQAAVTIDDTVNSCSPKEITVLHANVYDWLFGTAAPNTDKTGYSLTQSFPANFATLGINASGHVSRVTLVDTTTANTDMRGTDNAATAANLTTLQTDVTAMKGATFDTLTDSLEAIRNRGDAAWITATGFSTLTTGDIPTAAAIATAVLTTAMTEAYRTAGAAPTLAQAQFELIAHMGDSAITGTTKTIRKIDGITAAKTYTLDSATAPSSITEAT